MTLAILLSFFTLFSKPNEVRAFTHINGKNFDKTEVIILHSRKIMFIPDHQGITQRWTFEDFKHNTYRIVNESGTEGVISFTRMGAIMRVGTINTEFTNHRLRTL